MVGFGEDETARRYFRQGGKFVDNYDDVIQTKFVDTETDGKWRLVKFL